MTSNYDAIIIGTGQAGPSLAVRLAGAGMQVAIIEAGRNLAVFDGDLLCGALPLYVRDNSYGEFVFDWSWADAYERAGDMGGICIRICQW